MSLREVKATGLEALTLATKLLQRARRADPRAGLWEAADVQWWWGRPRQSDEVEKPFWVDDEGAGRRRSADGFQAHLAVRRDRRPGSIGLRPRPRVETGE